MRVTAPPRQLQKRQPWRTGHLSKRCHGERSLPALRVLCITAAMHSVFVGPPASEQRRFRTNYSAFNCRVYRPTPRSMVSPTPAPLSETLSTPLGLGIAIYLLIGFLVTGFIIVRGMKLRRPLTKGLLWDKRDNARNSLFLFQNIVLLSPIASSLR